MTSEPGDRGGAPRGAHRSLETGCWRLGGEGPPVKHHTTSRAKYPGISQVVMRTPCKWLGGRITKWLPDHPRSRGASAPAECHASGPYINPRVKDRACRFRSVSSSIRSGDRRPARPHATWQPAWATGTNERLSPYAAPSQARGNAASRDPHPRKPRQCLCDPSWQPLWATATSYRRPPHPTREAVTGGRARPTESAPAEMWRSGGPRVGQAFQPDAVRSDPVRSDPSQAGKPDLRQAAAGAYPGPGLHPCGLRHDRLTPRWPRR